MKNKYKMLITLIAAIIFTFIGVDVAIGGFQAGYSPEYAVGALAVPAILWLLVVDFYQKYKKENKQTAA